LNLIRTDAPDYRIGAAGVQRARAVKRVALAAVLPTLNGQLSYTHQFLTQTLTIGPESIATPPANVLGAGATFAWSIVDPRALYAVGTANRNVDAVSLGFSDKRREIAIAVVNAMLASLAAQRVAELNRVGLRAALERLALAQARLRFAQGTPLDVDRGEQDVAAARALLITGDELLRQVREDFGATVGSAVPLGAYAGLDLDQFEAAVAKTCHLNADLEQRPDVRAARERLEIARRQVHDAELELSPTLSVSSQGGYSSQVSFGPKTQWLVQGVVTLPFYDGGARYGRRRDAIAAEEQARQALVATRVNAVIDSARADRNVGVTQASRDVAQAQRDLADRVDQRTRAGYADGFGTSLDLVTSAQNLRQAEINLVLRKFDLGKARANAVLADAECLY
jgi:outer membrane protein TolC